MDELSRHDWQDPMALIQGLWEFLDTDINIGEHETVTSNRGYRGLTVDRDIVRIRIAVRNIATIWQTFPRVVFIGVGVTVTDLTKGSMSILPRWAREMRKTTSKPPMYEVQGAPHYMRMSGQEFVAITPEEERLGDVLFPGQSVVYELEVPVKDVPYVDFRVECTVSTRNLFHTRRVLPIPTNYSRPPLIAALRAINNIRLFESLDSLINVLPEIGPDTHMVDVQSLVGLLPKTISDVDSVLREVYDLGRVPAPNATLRIQVEAAAVYLRRLKETCNTMRNAIASGATDHMISGAKTIQSLRAETYQLNIAIETLMQTHDISDLEAYYRYRNR
jgi:hypothetical protein